MNRLCLLVFALFLSAIAVAKQETAPPPEGVPQGTAGMSQAEKKAARLNELYETGRSLYEARDLPGAHAAFEEMLMIEPHEPRAETYLENTRAEWERYQAETRKADEAKALEEKGVEFLKTPVTTEMIRPTPLDEFLNNLSFISGVHFSVAAGVQTEVNAKFVGVPLRDVLDAVLVPKGLKWTYSRGMISIVPALKVRVFTLSGENLAKVKSLYDQKFLHKMLWGGEGQPELKGESLSLDERNHTLTAMDSETRLEKLASLLTDVDRAVPPGLVTRYYKIEEKSGPKIKSLLDEVVRLDRESPFDVERRIYLSGEDLIIRDSPQRVEEMEKLLRDQKFIERLLTPDIEIAAFNLLPRDALSENPELLKSFAQQVQEQVMTYLYSTTGAAEAAAQGRKMWYDPNTLSLVITDTPEHIREVKDFLDSLPELRSLDRFRVIPLKYALSEDLEGELLELLQLRSAEDEAEKGLSIKKSLRTEDEFTWRDLTILVRNVTSGGNVSSNTNTNTNTNTNSFNSANNPKNQLNTKFDDSVELLLRIKTPTGITSQTVTLTEKRDSQSISDGEGGEYEIYADDVRPSDIFGSGRARLVITYSPPLAPPV